MTAVSFVRGHPDDPADVQTFLDIERSIGITPVYSPTTDQNEAVEELTNNVVYFIRDGEKTVGSVMYELKSPDHAYIGGLAICPEFQGQGVGKMAMEKVLEELKGVGTVDLVTHPDNERAIALYESLGFKRGEVIPNYFGDGEPRMVMCLERSQKLTDARRE